MEKSKSGKVHGNKDRKGQIPWNKGLTKETDARVAKMSRNISASLNTEESRRKRAKSAKVRWENPEQHRILSESIKTLWQDPIYSENLKAIHKKRCNEPENIQRVSALHKRLWTDPEYAKMMNDKKRTEANRRSIGTKAKKRFEDPEYMKKVLHRRIPSYPEQIFINLCKEFKYVGNGDLNIGGKNPDFVSIKDDHKLIEIWGKHFKEGRNPQDLIDFYKVRGYQCIIIWASELRYPENVVAKVKNFEEA